MEQKLEEQRRMSMAVGVAVAGLVDAKATKEVYDKLNAAQKRLEGEYGDIYDLDKAELDVNRAAPARDSGGLTAKQMETWKNAGKIDLMAAKMMGKSTGAPWSKIHMGNLEGGSASDISGQIDQTTGEQVIKALEYGRQRQGGVGRMRPGARRKS